ncbi:MAG: hypothetical protein QOF72_3045 [Blastocatellia bacterium]|nr:hypothetical protein [Blastocatellia bacterium]
MGSGESTQPFWAIPKVNYRMITSLDKTSEASIAGVCVSRAESIPYDVHTLTVLAKSQLSHDDLKRWSTRTNLVEV